MKAWKSVFPCIAVIACFLHVFIFIKIRDRSSKKYKDFFSAVGEKIWHCYEAESKAAFSQRVRRHCEYANAENLLDVFI